MPKKKLKKDTRKGLFVDGPTFIRFRELAKKDDRTYSKYLDRLMDLDKNS